MVDLAERMRRVVAEHPWATPVRINIGMAAAPPDQPVSVAGGVGMPGTTPS